MMRGLIFAIAPHYNAGRVRVTGAVRNLFVLLKALTLKTNPSGNQLWSFML
jgi:hypothetical protein